MTPHVEKTGKHIYGVRFSWVRAGWVKAFPFLLTDDSPHAFVTYPAEIVLNMDDPELYALMRKTLAERVMPKKAHDIDAQIRYAEALPNRDAYQELLLFLLKLEQTRREQRRRIQRGRQ